MAIGNFIGFRCWWSLQGTEHKGGNPSSSSRRPRDSNSQFKFFLPELFQVVLLPVVLIPVVLALAVLVLVVLVLVVLARVVAVVGLEF